MIEFDLILTYSFISIFDAQLKNPFNDWSAQHVEQGFAWRPGSVSFGTIATGQLIVTVDLSSQFPEPADNAQIAIIVPFEVANHSQVEIGDVSNSRRIDVPEGKYKLFFEHGGIENDLWCKLIFSRTDSEVSARIVRGITIDDDKLVMTAYPA